MAKELTKEQKNILFEEATEAPGSSQLNYEKKGNKKINKRPIFERNTKTQKRLV